MSDTERRHTVCRACHVACDLIVEVEAGVPVKIIGNKDNPVFKGFSCVKGRQLGAYGAMPTRLLHAHKRTDAGHERIDTARAIEEIADRIGVLVRDHGPRSVAIYMGTHGYNNFPSHAFARSLLESLGSPMLFNAVTIDQPGKAIAMALHGPWLAGTPPRDSWESLLLIGTNPVVSMNGGLGANPAGWLHIARKRGMKLVVIDPRVTDVARRADVHLQVRPGQDPAVLAGIARVLIEEGLYDESFVTTETHGLEALRAAVAPFTPQVVAERAGITADDLVRAARVFADGRSGAVSCGTGPNMSGHGNVTEYFVKVLTSLKGFWLRAGDVITNPGVMVNRAPPIAGSPGPFPARGYGEKMRIRGLEETPAGLPVATLPDEILLPGDGQVKALLVFGGNPMAGWPDQQKTFAAMQALDLLVCVDPVMTGTAKLAHYVIPPKLPLEAGGVTMHNELFGNFGPGWGFEVPYAQYTPAVVEPPVGSDLIEDWELSYGIARRLNLPIRLHDWSFPDPATARRHGTDLDVNGADRPTTEDILEIISRHAPVPFAEVKRLATGPAHVFERPPMIVQPKPADWTGRLDIGSADLLSELASVLHEVDGVELTEYPYRVISRRLLEVNNSGWHDVPLISQRTARNGAFMNPADLADALLSDGDLVRIVSPHAAISGIVRADATVRRGCISMSHAWGGNPGDDDDPRVAGGNTGRLIPTDREFDRYTGIPRMSSIPVRLERWNP